METGSFDDLHSRFDALVREANQNGIDALVILNNENPISGEAGLATLCASTPIKQLGMARFGLLEIEARFARGR